MQQEQQEQQEYMYMLQ
jgi:hypothetical protein